MATWLTSRSIGLDAEGYGRVLGRTVQIWQQLEQGRRALGRR